jgi:allantoin racemase
VPLICDDAALQVAADAVCALAPALRALRPAGVIVAAFGDPGHAQLSELLDCPVIGIAQAGMAQAAQGGRRFCVVTTTPDLERAILATAQRYGLAAQCLGVRLTPGDPRALMADPAALQAALLHACEMAVVLDGAQAIVIGGGPLAVVARALATQLPVPVIEPVPAAVQLLLARIAGRP